MRILLLRVISIMKSNSFIGIFKWIVIILTLEFAILRLPGHNARNIDDCEALCSNVYDPVCGEATQPDGVLTIEKYHNVCHLNQIRCLDKDFREIRQIPDKVCKIKKKLYRLGARRVFDFGITGAHQACNHTCPLYCTDVYDPACAQIWKRGMAGSSYKPIINHCHIDMLSCALALNITIHPLGKCFKNSAGLMFMGQVAALKSIKLLED